MSAKRRKTVRLFLAALSTMLLINISVVADLPELDGVGELHEGRAEHLDQRDLLALIQAGRNREAFELAFEHGDELFETVFNALDGVGADVGDGSRFTRVPRADLVNVGAWATHIPSRATGPNAQNCNACHNIPVDDGAGLPAGNVHRDPLHSGNIGQMIQRNTPHVFAPGAVQRLAEEMTERLHEIRAQATDQACEHGGTVTRTLSAKGIPFGVIRVTRTATHPCDVSVDTSGVVGVDADLVVKPFQWKGSRGFLRDFNRDASHNELGMQAVEIVGYGVDGDHDHVVNEFTVGDQTALAVYLAAQPRPTSKLELASLGLISPLPPGESFSIVRGAGYFAAVGCADCHRQQLRIEDPVFREPSRSATHRDATFPAGQNPVAEGVDPLRPVRFDLTRDQPDNQIRDANGNLIFHLGALRRDGQRAALVQMLGDLKRHNMGPELAESIDEVGTGAATFLTENLWGVGSTAPYMHDGRATTIYEAILYHGGEAAGSRALFLSQALNRQMDIVNYLHNLVLFKIEEPE